MPTRETASFIMAVTVKIPIYPRIEQVFDDLLADIFEQFAGIARVSCATRILERVHHFGDFCF
jgi:hypothetical protein